MIQKHTGARERYAGTSLLARYADGAYAMLVRSKFLHDLGPALSAGNAHAILTGIETLPVRTAAATGNLLLLANFLAAHPLLKAVHHPSRSTHRHHERAAKFFPRGTGSVLAIELHDAALVPAFIDNLKIITLAANIGDTRTMIAHPATMTHCRLTESALAQAGLNAAVLRLSVGLEDPADLIRDLDHALAAAQATTSITKEVSFA